MSKVCDVTGVKPLSGNNVSHAHNKTKRRFDPNIHSHRFWLEKENKWVKLNVSKKGLKTIEKLGIEAVRDEQGLPISNKAEADKFLGQHWGRKFSEADIHEEEAEGMEDLEVRDIALVVSVPIQRIMRTRLKDWRTKR